MNLEHGSIAFHPIAYIELPGGMVWYFSDQALSLSSGNFAEPRLGVDRVQESLPVPTAYGANPFRQPLTLTLDDHDGTLYPTFDTVEWANGTVNLYYGEGKAWTNYTQVFGGKIIVPNGVGFDNFHVTVNAECGMEYENTYIPNTSANDFAGVEEKSKDKFIPIVYGDFDAANMYSVPCICIDDAVPEFKIADHNIRSIGNVYKNTFGNIVVPDATDLALATFTLVTAGYDETKDTIWAKVEGKSDNPAGGGALIEHPVDVVQDLLTTYLGATGLIDAATFAAAKATLTAAGLDVCRGYLSERSLAMWYVMQLCDECGLDLVLKNGTYYLSVQEYNPTIATTHYIRDTDIVRGSYGVVRDPNKIYGNKIYFSYSYAPYLGHCTVRAPVSNAVEIAAAGITLDKHYDFMWLYDNALGEIDTRVEAICDIISSRIQVITLDVKYRGFNYGLGDYVALNFRQFNNDKFQIRGISRMFGSQPRVRLELWAMCNYPQNSSV